MNRRRIVRHHFPFKRVEAMVIDISPRLGRPVSIAAVLEDIRPYWIRAGISKVFGAAPAIVFTPPGPMASIRRTLRKAPSAKQRAAWDRFSAMQNGAGDQKDGYDHGECERETRGIH